LQGGIKQWLTILKKVKVREYGLKIKDDRGNIFASLQEAADFYKRQQKQRTKSRLWYDFFLQRNKIY
jgi:hypothetical protein